ncbi:somatomedin-B and thrombospondin type-1 domain-containing protein-like [Dromiciops gliroides]|uniref:somatomedin-B and thrombospondin type-1 domain-containing protein-like n=1 Tax=Dromiciops gliroides TaxID=33562 RepID=UPI001CC3D143|nr:somatomedin-B and thrombospondin type-1 domain-containing protein-like [Dromiciops gliroides]
MAHSAVLAWVWALALGTVPGAQAGCAELGRCCPGRDLTCVSRGWTAAGPSLGPQPCYCDQACSAAGDCCRDYGSACPAVTCTVSEWSGWSRCVEPCTITFRVRRRQVLREPRNGGGPCPPLEERAGCVEYWSHQGVECKQALIPALITTGAFRNGRKKRALAHERKSAGYCVMFQLVTITVGCLQTRTPYTQWMRYLTQGHTVCVMCEPPALDRRSLRCYGDGKGSRGDQLLQWQAVGNPSCRGTWKRFQQLEVCSCPAVHSFLFV